MGGVFRDFGVRASSNVFFMNYILQVTNSQNHIVLYWAHIKQVSSLAKLLEPFMVTHAFNFSSNFSTFVHKRERAGHKLFNFPHIMIFLLQITIFLCA
jgi:uncharacterized membrane protein YwaF